MKSILLAGFVFFTSASFAKTIGPFTCGLAVAIDGIGIAPSANAYVLQDADLDLLIQKGYDAFPVNYSEDAGVLHLAWSQTCENDGLGACTFKAYLRQFVTVGFPLYELEESRGGATLQEALQSLSDCTRL